MESQRISELTISRIITFKKIDLSAGYSLTRTDRPQCALTMKCCGRTTYVCGGRQYVSDPSSVLFIPRGADYQFRVEDPGACLMAEFDVAEDIDPHELTAFSVTTYTPLISCFERAANYMLFKKPGYFHRCMSELYNMLAFLTEQQMISYQNQRCLTIIRPAIEHFEMNCSDPNLTCADLADIAGISEVYFRKIFTSLYGTSPAKYIRTVRIEKAKNLLLGEKLSVGEAAERSGFVSLYHFSRTFKNIVGLSPTEYINKVQSEGLL